MSKISPEDKLEKELVKAAIPLLENYLKTIANEQTKLKTNEQRKELATDIAEKIFPDAIAPAVEQF